MPYLESAIDSALAQTGVEVEIIIVDDHGLDDSFEYARARAQTDARIRVFQTYCNQGPGCARNVAIEHMHGRWFAVLDSDDLIVPDRSAILIAEAEKHKADLVADDLIVFGEGITESRFIVDSDIFPGEWIDAEFYFQNTHMFSKSPNLGFLKPIIRHEALIRNEHRYRSDLRIAEDDELIMRLLLNNCRYRFVPNAGYRYRKHVSSISHRLSLENAERMLVSERAIAQSVQKSGYHSRAYEQRLAALESAVAFTRSIDALKQGRIVRAIQALAEKPSAVRHFSSPLAARLARLSGSRQR